MSGPLRAAIAAVLACWFNKPAAAGPTQLPAGKILAGYQDWQECNRTQTFQAVEDGVNVVIWFAINLLADSQASPQPQITSGPDLQCVAEVVRELRDRGFADTVHLISVGGWGAPHPDTRFSGRAWFETWDAWNRGVVARPSLGFEGFDGIDWDIEGINNVYGKDSVLTVALMDLVGEMSTLAKAAGYVTSLVPMESHMNPSNNYVGTTMTAMYLDWEEWRATGLSHFPYHACNQYAYIYAKYPDAFDLIIYQIYESFTHVNFVMQILGRDPVDVVDELVRRLTYGWYIYFSQLPGSTLKDGHFRIPASKLLVAYGNGWAGSESAVWPTARKQLYVDTAYVRQAIERWSRRNGTTYPAGQRSYTFEEPRGVGFWSIHHEGLPAADGTRGSVWFAREVNEALRTRPPKVSSLSV